GSFRSATRSPEAGAPGRPLCGAAAAARTVGGRISCRRAARGLAPASLGVEKLYLAERFPDRRFDLGRQQVDDRTNRFDSDPGLLEIDLVLLDDPAGAQVEHRSHGLGEQVLDPDLAHLLFEQLTLR